MDVYRFREGTKPLLVSVPHDGREIPAPLAGRMTTAARRLPDTDWHVATLYEFAAGLGASVIVANFSRYVVDLNRPPSDATLYPGQVATGLCPESTFGGDPVYADERGVADSERAHRVGRYWRPYHDRIREELTRIRGEHGVALLWDAHSIASRVPRLFAGELPELNVGTNLGQSCSPACRDAVLNVAIDSTFSVVADGRFRGGYITRHYGVPEDGIHAIQLELAQRAYMDEDTLRYDGRRAGRLIETLDDMLRAFMAAAAAGNR